LNFLILIFFFLIFFLCFQSTVSEALILIKTSSGEDIQLKFPDKEVMKRWLFEFQKSVALVLIHILEARNKALNQFGVRGVQSRIPGGELTHQESEYGHGNYANIARRHSLKGLEDLGGDGTRGKAQSLVEDSSVFDFTRWKQDFPNSPMSSPNKGASSSSAAIPMAMSAGNNNANNLRMMAVSPAIPIGMQHAMKAHQDEEEEESDYRGRVASSYRDEDNGLSPMADLLNREPYDYDDEEDDEEPDHITVSTQAEDDEDDE
jgi:hypothetical protein